MTTVQDQSPCPVEAIGRTLEATISTIADMVAENDQLYRVSSETADAVTAIEYAAKDAIAASEPVTVPISWHDPKTERVVTHNAILLNGEPSAKGDAGSAAVVVCFLERDLIAGRALTTEHREMVERYRAARQESIERADAIRAKVYAEMGYEAAKAADDAATEAADAHSEQLNNAPIRTMADAIAALEFIRDINAEWDGLGDRALAFLKKGGVQ